MEDNFVNHEQGIGIPILICIYCTLLFPNKIPIMWLYANYSSFINI